DRGRRHKCRHLPSRNREPNLFAGVYCPVWEQISKGLDRWAIRMACSSVTARTGEHNETEAEQLLHAPEFFNLPVPSPVLTFSAGRRFSFDSPINTQWQITNRVHGRLYRTGSRWRDHPAVILLHGWNSELAYARQFPYL